MRINNLQIVFLAIGVILNLINSYTGIKILWYIGCICIIISPFLPGLFHILSKNNKSTRDKKNNLLKQKNCSSDSVGKDTEQENLPPS